MNPRELREKRANLIAQARALVEAAEAANRDLTTEERTNYDRMMTEVDELRQRAERIERQAVLDAELGQSAGQPVHTQTPPAGGEQRGGQQGGGQPANIEARQAAFLRYVRGGREALSQEEYRALQADSDTGGGFLTAPQTFLTQLIQQVDNAVYLRQWGTPNTLTTSQSLGVPTLETDPDDADWTTELKTGSEDSSMSFGKRELRPHPMAKRIKISRTLLRLSPSAENIVRQRLGYKFEVTWEKAGMTGDGNKKPLGVFVASNDGIPTSRDMSTGNTTTAITFDNLTRVKYSIKQAYWPMLKWIFHRDVVREVALIKDGNGQYIWRESVRAGEPDRLLNIPLFMSEYAPSTMTTGLYVGILGDFSHYWYADSLSFEIRRLDELYAETDEVGLIGRWESDGQPVLPEAFARVKLA